MIRSLIRCNKNTLIQNSIIKPIISTTTTISTSTSTNRNYFYTINIHGELFLADTKYRNSISCFKDKTFLDFFFNRIKPNLNHEVVEEGVKVKDQEAYDKIEKLKFEELGYNFISNCGKELNYIKPDDSVLVYQTLDNEKGKKKLKNYHCCFSRIFIYFFFSLPLLLLLLFLSSGLSYAGTLYEPFSPSSLRVCSKSGYLYHPSPLALPSSKRKQSQISISKSNNSNSNSNSKSERNKGIQSQFGEYSLLRSSLVLENFSNTLDMFNEDDEDDENGEDPEDKEEVRGSYEWQGKRYEIKNLKEGMVIRSKVKV